MVSTFFGSTHVNMVEGPYMRVGEGQNCEGQEECCHF